MPRFKRIQFPGMIAHVMSRGNEKKKIFRNDSDRLKFIELIKNSFSSFDYVIHAYCLMPNHYHLLIESIDGRLGELMKLINGHYAQHFNWKYRRTGHLFSGRYKSIVVEKDTYMVQLAKYIHLNPLKKGLVEKLSQYKWCSYGEYMGKKGFGITDPGWVLGSFDKDATSARDRFKMYLTEEAGIEEEMIDASIVNDIVYGSANFIEIVKTVIAEKGKIMNLKVLRTTALKPENIIFAVAKKFNISREELIRKKGKWNYAKKIAIYYVNKFCNCTASETGKLFNIHYSVINRVVNSINKEKKDNPDLYSIMQSIESAF